MEDYTGFLGKNPYQKGLNLSEKSGLCSIYVDEVYEPSETEGVKEGEGYLIFNPAVFQEKIGVEAVSAYLNGENRVLALIEESPHNVLEEKRGQLESYTNTVLIAEESENVKGDYLNFHATKV